ncbi:MAG TPA: LacI family DNA-binding transcriptional regulator [Candidatus Fimivicinus intestinavium]|nr:LacI family DNA-binding transcriptional regulator [Candidatus Fimivicinus intestinavium]
MSATIKDIAREAGVSVSAVSLVLNNRPCRITQDKKELIRETAQRLNYAPNQAARSLVTKKTRTLALILPDIENPFFSSLAKRIEDCCQRDGYLLLIASSNDQFSSDCALLREITSHGVDGLFLIVSNESYQENTRLLEALSRLPFPYIQVDRVYDNLVCDKVLFDNEQGARIATRHLLENGHTRIAYVANTSANNGRARLAGYRAALEEDGLPFDPALVAEGDYRFDSGYRAAKALLKTDATAAFVSNDMMALGFLKYLYSQGLRVPKDFSLVSYDNSLSPFALGVELTSVAQDAQRLGEEACRLLTGRIKNKSAPPRTVCLEPELILRSSVKRLREH